MPENMSTDIEYLSATELSAGFAAGSISPVAATAAALAAIDAQDGALNAFRLVDAEAARAAAAESERRWQAKSSLSPLDGVPVSIKDLLLTKGWPTLRGSKLVDPEQAWVEDAPSWRIQRTRNLAGQYDAVSSFFDNRVRDRDTRNKRLSVRVARVAIQLVTFGYFDYSPKVHDCDSIADMPHHGEIVCHKQIREV